MLFSVIQNPVCNSRINIGVPVQFGVVCSVQVYLSQVGRIFQPEVRKDKLECRVAQPAYFPELGNRIKPAQLFAVAGNLLGEVLGFNRHLRGFHAQRLLRFCALSAVVPFSLSRPPFGGCYVNDPRVKGRAIATWSSPWEPGACPPARLQACRSFPHQSRRYSCGRPDPMWRSNPGAD